ncbi:response regulator transcription factor [Paenibacillus sp. LHD-117]|uniref:response regulator transcription factor n=1 Tax=Paenibacillus sp. LHD-117 TaxID=3071412 RepID=UPI0027E0AA51|nr:response regulator transcription factor [Paenibacillus sp. LHD-117]MDQ6419855.1 response regulator transcription factor [Paenibacillus sp. LHD-117]
MYKIFIVEDDDKIASILAGKMEQYGYVAAAATNFRDLMPQLAAFDPQLVLLDINLPYFDGYYWCRQIRMRSSMPIIFISARAGEMDQVMALENGGDDYITKPIALELLMAKVRGALRRVYGEYAAPAATALTVHGQPVPVAEDTGHELAAGELKLHLSRNEAEWRGRRVELTKNEILLAECLLRKPGHVISREQLLEALWDDVQFVDDNTLTVNVTRLRKKLEELGLPKVVETIRGQGYKLSLEGMEERQ